MPCLLNLSKFAAVTWWVLGIAMSQVAGAPTNTTTTRFNFLHVFAPEPHVLVLDSVETQFVLNTTPDAANANTSTSVQGNTNYIFAGSNRVGFPSNQWQLDRDVGVNGSVWTRLQSSMDSATLDVCAIVVPGASLDAQTLVEVAAQVKTFCTSRDMVLLGFTAPLSAEFTQYLTGNTAFNGTYTPLALNEFVNFTQQTPNTQVKAVGATNRLFVAFPSPACVENEVTGTSMTPGMLTMQRASLCVGSNCTTCGAASGSTEPTTHVSSVKRGLIVMLSCGTFLIGCALVFYIFFRKQFFMPSEASKSEKELTTNLAYVLRM